MAIDTNRIKFFDQPNLSFEVRLYIEDSGDPGTGRNPEYVDFTNRLSYQGESLLRKIGEIKQTAEIRTGINAFTSSINQIDVNNEDGFWNKPIERGEGAAYPVTGEKIYPSNLKTVENNTAYFELTQNYTQNSWNRHKIKLILFTLNKDGQVVEDDLVVALINDITRSTNSNDAIISLWGLAMPLKELDVSNVRNGLSWWANRSIGFLIRKILQKQYRDVPSNFVLPEVINIPTAGITKRTAGEIRLLSSYGAPPEFDIDAQEWKNKGLVARTLCKWQWNETGADGEKTSNAVLIAENNASQLTCETGSSDTGLKPRVGDAITILQDDVYNNTGSYVIKDIVGSTVVLETPLSGLANTSSTKLPFVINRVYMGCDNELWEYLPDRDVYRYMGKTFETTEGDNDDYKIRRVWYNPNDNKLYIAAWRDPDKDGYLDTASNEIPHSKKTVTMKIFRYDQSETDVANAELTLFKTISDVFVGDFAYRDSRNVYSTFISPVDGVGTGINQWGARIGVNSILSFNNEPTYYERYDENLSVPFLQNVVPINVAGYDGDTQSAVPNGVGRDNNQAVKKYGDDGFIVIGLVKLLSHLMRSGAGGAWTSSGDRTAGVSGFEAKIWDNFTNPSAPLNDVPLIPADYYALSAFIKPEIGAGSPPGAMWLRHTYGQTGCVVFNKNGGSTYTNGVIWYFTMVFNGTYPDGDLRLNCLDLLGSGTPLLQTSDFTTQGKVTIAGTGRIYYDGTGDWTEANTSVHQPLSGCVPPDGEEGVIFSLLFWSATAHSPQNDSITSTSPTLPTAKTTISRYSVDTSANRITLFETSETDTLPTAKIVPLEMIPINGKNKILISGYFRDNLEKTYVNNKPYGLVFLETNKGSLIESIDRFGDAGTGAYLKNPQFWRRRQPMRLTLNEETRLKTYDSSLEGDRVYFIEGGSGSLYVINTNTNNIRIKDNGAPIVDGEVYCGSNIIVDKITRTRSENSSSNAHFNELLWGISSNTPMRESLLNPFSGKYYLWKFDCFISGRIELANFENMFAWDALSNMAQISDHIMGFDSDAFYFIPRLKKGPAEYTFKNDGAVSRVENITVSDNRREIYNSVEIVPSVVVLKQPTWKFELVSRSSALQDPNIDIILDQRDVKTKTIRMVCVIGGRITQNNEDTNGIYSGGLNEGIWFKYFIFDQIIETSLRAALNEPVSATSLFLNEGLLDIEVGDTIEVYTVQNGFEFKAVYNVIAIPTSSQIESGQVSVSYNTTLSTSSLKDSNFFVINSIVKVIKNEGWSDVTDTGNLLQVNAYDTFFEVGDSNIFIKFNSDENINSLDESQFIAGDTLTIEAPGLVLEKHESARQLAVNMRSIQQYGRNPYPTIDNPFINFKIARGLTVKILNDFSHPHNIITVTTKLLPFVKFISNGTYMSLFAVVDKFLFPTSYRYERKGHLRSVSFNFTNATSKFILRDINPY